jgi:putative Mn2+ efflux pump MntP
MEGEASATSQMWKKLALLGVIVAILMMLVGIGCMFLSTVGGLVFMAIALFGVTLALVGAIKSKKAEA